jgi:pullulanase
MLRNKSIHTVLQEDHNFGYGEDEMVSKKIDDLYNYNGNDLGATWSKQETKFRVWAPTASKVVLNFYQEGSGGEPMESSPMTQDVEGTWVATKSGDWNGIFYTYLVTVDDVTREAVDPYARTVGVNGDRGMVIDLASTDPIGFIDDKKPILINSTDAIIYELHVRDFSIDANSGMKNKGKYLAFAETGTTTPTGEKTGVDYLVDLGITHVHLLPVFDYASVDEASPDKNEYNWGYDPKNYNVPEGSYSTDPYKGKVRVKEFKQMVQALHNHGIRVIMDVVYNHTFNTESNLNKVVPEYYYRMNENGTYSDASACGNETASDRAMMRKYIVDSVVFWATEYHVDGFRFDLMGIHDIETMNAVREALNKIDSTIIVYGEGWTGGTSTLPERERAMKVNTPFLRTGIASFSDDLRDGVKGSVFEPLETGFATGNALLEETIKFGVIASTKHSQVDYSKVNYSTAPWAKEPTQTISYISAHDNHTLWDKISISKADDCLQDRIKMNLLASAIVLTSQGTPFFQAGEEILRSKPSDTGIGFVENSYNSSDAVNSIKWDTVSTNQEVYRYYQGLIAFRKAHSSLRMTKTQDIQANLTFMDGIDANVVAYIIKNQPNGETAEAICVILNANKTATTVTLPEGNWNVYVKGNQAGIRVLESVDRGFVRVEPISALVLVKELA